MNFDFHVFGIPPKGQKVRDKRRLQKSDGSKMLLVAIRWDIEEANKVARSFKTDGWKAIRVEKMAKVDGRAIRSQLVYRNGFWEMYFFGDDVETIIRVRDEEFDQDYKELLAELGPRKARDELAKVIAHKWGDCNTKIQELVRQTIARHKEEEAVIRCHCRCPYFGIEHDHIFEVECRCGNKESACGHCLEAGRVTQCLECSRRDLRVGAGRN